MLNLENFTTQEIKKLLDDLQIEYEHRKTRETIEKFFNDNKKEIDFFRNWNVSMYNITDSGIDAFIGVDWDIVHDLIILYENVNQPCDEIEKTIDFMYQLDKIGLSDNSMCESLKVSYYYCVNAIIEYLENGVY